MKTRIGQVIPFVLFILMSGCSSEPQRSDPPEGFFATYIDNDGLKNFQYSIEIPETKSKGRKKPPGNIGGQVSGSSGSGVKGGLTAGTNSRSKKGPPSGRGGSDHFQKINDQLENMLEHELSKSAFCHTGHRETDRNLKPPTVYIRGECTEKATDDDRDRFPDDTG